MMKSFNLIKDHLNSFFEEYEKAEVAFRECIGKINDVYKEGEFYDYQMRVANDIFTKKVADLKEQALISIKKEIAVINSNLQNIVTNPCPVEVVSTLSILNPEDVTEKELQLYFSKFNDNYSAMRILHNMAVEKYGHDAEKLLYIGDSFTSVDSLMDDINYIQNESEVAINNCSDQSLSNKLRIATLLSRDIDRVEIDYERFAAMGGENG